jgi:hypothetical protein
MFFLSRFIQTPPRTQCFTLAAVQSFFVDH